MGKIGADRDYEQCFDNIYHITEHTMEDELSSESLSLYNKTAWDAKRPRHRSSTQSAAAPMVCLLL